MSAEIPLPEMTLRRRVARSPWLWLALAVPALVYLMWAGSSYDPRRAALWMFTREGWFSLAPGLGHFWIASAMVFGLLSAAAWFGRDTPAPGRVWQWVTAAAIVMAALDFRLAVLRYWLPLPLDPAVLGARSFQPPIAGRGWAVAAEMVTLGILLAALAMRGRNLWPAALLAVHPLALMQGAGSGAAITWLMPVLALVGMGWRYQRWLRDVLIMGAAAGCTWWVARLALTEKPFNGLLAEILDALGLEGRSGALVLVAVEAALQVLVVYMARRRGWDLARTLGHILLAWAIVSPRVMPADVLPILVLLPLSWTRGGWVLSGTILALYAMVPFYRPPMPWHVPEWVTYLMMTPVLVVTVEEWLLPRKVEAPVAESAVEPAAAAEPAV